MKWKDGELGFKLKGLGLPCTPGGPVGQLEGVRLCLPRPMEHKGLQLLYFSLPKYTYNFSCGKLGTGPDREEHFGKYASCLVKLPTPSHHTPRTQKGILTSGTIMQRIALNSCRDTSQGRKGGSTCYCQALLIETKDFHAPSWIILASTLQRKKKKDMH